MLGLRQRSLKLFYRLWLAWFKRRNPHVQFGRAVRLKGRPLFAMAPTARVRIGNDVVFTSDPTANLVGLSRPCSVAVLEGAELTIGDGCGFSGVAICCAKGIHIGRNLTCGGNVSIWDTDFHPIEAEARRKNIRDAIKSRPIFIGDDVFIGANAILLKGITIGDRAVIAAGSVVAKDIPADEIWGGNPVRLIRSCAGVGAGPGH